MTEQPARPGEISIEAAALALAERDPVLARLVDQVGLPSFPAPTETLFATLVRSIVYQQLAGAAAGAIHGRLILALEGDVTPERMLALTPETLRSVGLSGRKAATLLDLSSKVLDGTVSLDPQTLARESDDEIVARLTTVRGIGKWSAEIFLIFQLGRLDVWPTGDLAIRRGYGLAWGIPTPTPRQLDLLGEQYRPYRTILAWYSWRAARLYGGTAATAVNS
jgi:DNA-3-methyladenine glycosylase II